MQPVFVISTGRAGSQMIVHVLRLHPELCAFHEPPPRLSIESFASWEGRIDPDRVLRRVVMKRAPLVEQVQRNGFIYVESALWLVHLVPHLHKALSPKFVHLYRDGRAFVDSALARGWYSKSETKRGLASAVKTAVRHRFLVDIGTPGVEHRLRPPQEMKTRFEKLTWLWTEVNQSAMASLDAIPRDLVYRLPVEAVESHLEDLCQFIGVSLGSKLSEQMIPVLRARPNRSGAPSGQGRWSRDQHRTFERIAGPTMRKLGYTVLHEVPSRMAR